MLFKLKELKLTLLILFSFFLFITNLQSKIEDSFYKENFCENIDPSYFLDNKTPEEIIIEINNNKKWSKNMFALFLDLNAEKYKTGNKNWHKFQIEKKFKKNYKSKIIFVYKNPNFQCKAKANISVKGDLWWHLDWKNGYPFSSMKVDLKNGNLNNWVKFNLFIPESRTSLNKNPNLELFVTSLFNELKLLAPQSYLVKVRVNGNLYGKYLLQEGLEKEFLESRNLIEGPILEGDQRFTAEQYSSNKWRGDLGLAKVINSSYSIRDKANAEISFYALTLLNNIFIDSNQSNKENFQRCFDDYVSVNKEKYLSDKNEIINNQIYEALIFATETSHGFTCDDRKFYFDPIKKIFLPIYNDGKSELDFNSQIISEKLKNNVITKNAVEGIEESLNLINKIDDEKFYSNLTKSGFELSFQEYKQLKIKVINNLKYIKEKKEILIFPEENDYFKSINSDYFGKEVKLIFVNLEKNIFEICDLNSVNCETRSLAENKEEIIKGLLSQDYYDLKKKKILNENNEYLFLSTEKKYFLLKEINKKYKNYFKQVNINNEFKIQHNNSVDILVDSNSKNIKFLILHDDPRIKIVGENINNWTFELDGENFNKSNKKELFVKKNFDMLTGCLTFIDSYVENINIISKFSVCEDSINFIRTKGSINNIVIENSLSDALDLDFSNIKISSLFIKKAKNDCLDMSFGKYILEDALIEDCGDKGISVGEKSNLRVDKAKISNTEIGVAAKDSSDVHLTNTHIDSNICLAAYRKKQEFLGAIIKYNNLNCSNKKIINQKGSVVKKNEF